MGDLRRDLGGSAPERPQAQCDRIERSDERGEDRGLLGRSPGLADADATGVA